MIFDCLYIEGRRSRKGGREIRESHHNVTLLGIMKEIEGDDRDDVDEKILGYDPS